MVRFILASSSESRAQRKRSCWGSVLRSSSRAILTVLGEYTDGLLRDAEVIFRPEQDNKVFTFLSRSGLNEFQFSPNRRSPRGHGTAATADGQLVAWVAERLSPEAVKALFAKWNPALSQEVFEKQYAALLERAQPAPLFTIKEYRFNLGALIGTAIEDGFVAQKQMLESLEKNESKSSSDPSSPGLIKIARDEEADAFGEGSAEGSLENEKKEASAALVDPKSAYLLERSYPAEQAASSVSEPMRDEIFVARRTPPDAVYPTVARSRWDACRSSMGFKAPYEISQADLTKLIEAQRDAAPTTASVTLNQAVWSLSPTDLESNSTPQPVGDSTIRKNDGGLSPASCTASLSLCKLSNQTTPVSKFLPNKRSPQNLPATETDLLPSAAEPNHPQTVTAKRAAPKSSSRRLPSKPRRKPTASKDKIAMTTAPPSDKIRAP